MGIIRIEKTKNYTVMSNYHLRDKNLTLKAKGLMSLMLSLPEDWDYSIAGLVAIVSEGETAVRGAINELIDNHYLTRERVYENGKISDWNYTLYEMPTDVGLPVENQQLDNQVQDFSAQINKDINKIKNNKKAGAGFSSKIHPRNFTKNTLSDDLESGRDIDEQKKASRKSPKDKFVDECLDIIDDVYSEKNYSYAVHDLLVEYFEFVSAVPENKDNLCKRVKTVKQWKNKIDRLNELVKDGYEPEAIIRQSLEKKQYVFYPLQKSDSKVNKGRETLSDRLHASDPEYIRKRLAEDDDEEIY